MRVLIIEDNAKLAHAIELSLEQQGYGVELAHTGIVGEELARVEHYDAIVLDLMLPGRHGIDVCRDLRRREIRTPILMLSALGSTEEAILGLDAGADDYLTKPVKIAELLARLRSLLRRSHASEVDILESGDLRMNLRQRRVSIRGESVKLSAMEFSLLEFMMHNPGKLLTRSMISKCVWDMNHDPHSNVIEVYVSTLRRRIDRCSTESRIETVIGGGYRFLDPDGSDAAQGDAVPTS